MNSMVAVSACPHAAAVALGLSCPPLNTLTPSTRRSNTSRDTADAKRAHTSAGASGYTTTNPSPGAFTVCGATVTDVPQAVRKVEPSTMRAGARPSCSTRDALTPWKPPSRPKEWSTAVDRSRRLSCSTFAFAAAEVGDNTR